MDFPVFTSEGSITLITGKPRSGKTLLNAVLTLPYADFGYQVKSNFFLDSPNAEIISFYEMVSMLKGERFSPFILLSLQEIYGFFSSHRAVSDPNELASALVFQSGKLGINVVGDSQLITRADDSLRKMANYRFEAEKEALCDERKCFGCSYAEVCRFVYYELDTTYPDENIRTEESFVLSFEFAQFFWSRYHTYDRSVPLGMDSLLVKMERFEPELMNKTINRQTDLLIKGRDRYGFVTYLDVNKVAVEDNLLQLGEQIVFSSYVTNRLKSRLKYA